jgi:hypothetical protein
MTPDEHTARAEELLALAEDETSRDLEALLIARAHVHAILSIREPTIRATLAPVDEDRPPRLVDVPVARRNAVRRPPHVPANEPIPFDPDGEDHLR